MSELIKKQPMQSVRSTSSQDMFEVMEKAYKFSQIMAKSDIIPAHYRNKPENVFVAIQTAYRMDLDPMLVMQNTFVIAGKLGMNSSFAISLANSSGLFAGGIRYEVVGDGGTLQVKAYAMLKSNGEEISYIIGMKEAIAENWTKNPKYKSLPELMLRYRAATLLIRTHVPEVINGMHMVEEIEDITAAKSSILQPDTAISKLDSFLEQEEAKTEIEAEKEDVHLKLVRLVEMHNLPDEKIQAWCEKGGVANLVDLDAEKTTSCIKYIEAQAGVNGHKNSLPTNNLIDS
jgi:hypothetical protein